MADVFGNILDDDDDNFYTNPEDEILVSKNKYKEDVEDNDDFYTNSDDESALSIDDEGEPLKMNLKVKLEDDTDSEPVGINLKVKLEDDTEMEEDSKSNSSILSQEEKMRYYADKVLSATVGGKSINKYALGRLQSSVSPKIFRDENYILYSMLYGYRERIKNINVDTEFVSMYLDINREVIEKSTAYIDIHSYGEVDGSEVLGYITGVVKHFNRLCSMPEMSEEEFNLNLEKYIVLFKNVEAQKIYAKSNQILVEGLVVGRKKLVGFDDSFNFSRRQLAELEGLVDMNSGSGFRTMNSVIMDESTDSRKSIKISDFDKLEELNKHYGGVYTGNFYQVMAPAKAGKSKFCARLCHTTIVKYGNNVSVWAQEGGPDAWSAQMRAIHFDYTYNEGASITEKKFGVDQDVILHDKFETQELRDLETSSKIDLACNTDYGVVDFIDRPFEVETFLDEIDSSVKKNNSKLLIIDYLQLIGSQNSRLSDRERIARAYTKLLDYCKKNNIAVITPAQYKQDTIDALANKGDTADAEMRTAGGGSAEVLRTPDITFAFWASTADIRNNRMKVLSMPCRFNKPFPEIACAMDLGVCQFVSLSS